MFVYSNTYVHDVFLSPKVITSCNHTKEELIQEVENFNLRKLNPQNVESTGDEQVQGELPSLRYLDHVQTYPTFVFGGVVGSRVATVAFARN